MVRPIIFSVLEGPLLPNLLFIPRQTFKISYILWKIPSAKFDQNLRDSLDAIFSIYCEENGSKKEKKETQHAELR